MNITSLFSELSLLPKLVEVGEDMRQDLGDLAGLISLVRPGRRELLSLFVVFIISKVGVTECARLGVKAYGVAANNHK